MSKKYHQNDFVFFCFSLDSGLVDVQVLFLRSRSFSCCFSLQFNCSFPRQVRFFYNNQIMFGAVASIAAIDVMELEQNGGGFYDLVDQWETFDSSSCLRYSLQHAMRFANLSGRRKAMENKLADQVFHNIRRINEICNCQGSVNVVYSSLIARRKMSGIAQWKKKYVT